MVLWDLIYIYIYIYIQYMCNHHHPKIMGDSKSTNTKLYASQDTGQIIRYAEYEYWIYEVLSALVCSRIPDVGPIERIRFVVS